VGQFKPVPTITGVSAAVLLERGHFEFGFGTAAFAT
jgi:hypothetical protein